MNEQCKTYFVQEVKLSVLNTKSSFQNYRKKANPGFRYENGVKAEYPCFQLVCNTVLVGRGGSSKGRDCRTRVES